MNTLTATYRVVTPMFLGGADPLREAELRVPSFKGALRFWWRARVWGEVQNLEDLRQKEAQLFGSSEEGQSKVLMRIPATPASTQKMTENWSPWQRYTGYGLRDKGERCFIPVGHMKPEEIRYGGGERDKGERCFIPVGQEWIITLNLRRCDVAQSAQVLAALKLLGLIGGLGSRSRKGWGSVTLSKLDGVERLTDADMPWQCPSDSAGWRGALESLIPRECSDTAPFSAFTKASLWNHGPIKDLRSAQQWLGQQYQTCVKETAPKPNRAQFGLPRNFRNEPRTEHRGSPLFLHIHDCGNGKALPTALWLPSNFLPNNTPIPGNGTSARRFVETLNSVPTAPTP